MGYEVFAKRPAIKLIHCMVHARRMFNEAMDNDEARASHALQGIQKLYAIERHCRDTLLTADEIREVRKRESLPILEQLGSRMKEQCVQTLPKSTIVKALGYSIERRDRLSEYVNNRRLNTDNNPVENCIRPVALGRKNYLFAGSHEAAKRSGVLYSLLGTCKMHGIEPYTWLKDVLRVIADHPVNRTAELLPHRYKN